MCATARRTQSNRTTSLLETRCLSRGGAAGGVRNGKWASFGREDSGEKNLFAEEKNSARGPFRQRDRSWPSRHSPNGLPPARRGDKRSCRRRTSSSADMRSGTKFVDSISPETRQIAKRPCSSRGRATNGTFWIPEGAPRGPPQRPDIAQLTGKF
jgi:hypothetical protein